MTYGGHQIAGQLFSGDGLPMSQALPGTTQPPTQPNVFEDPWGIPTSIPGYPVLQANRPMVMQPSTRGEGMVYPAPSSNRNYAGPIQQHAPLSDHMIGPQTYIPPPTGVTGTPTSPSFSSAAYHGTFPPAAERPENLGQTRGLDFVLTNQRPAQAKRGPFKTTKERQATAETRKIGSCIRCRMQRIRASTPNSNLSGP